MIRSGPSRLVLSVGALLALGTLFRASSDTLDDAFITFRAAHNFVGGEGLTFNPGMAPVESFSNPLFLFLLIPFAALGVPLPWAAMALGIVGLGLALHGTSRLAIRAGLSELPLAVVLGSTLGSTALVYYASTGLETGLSSGLLLYAMGRTLDADEGGGRLDGLATLAWAAVAISRPETPLVLLFVLPTILRWPFDRRTILGLLAIAGTLVLLELGRIAYYGDFVPNTFHAKPPGTADHDPTTSGLVAGPAYVLRFAMACGLVLPIGAAWAGLSFFRRPLEDAHPQRRVVLAGALAALAAGLFFSLYAGGDWMPMGRYLVPYVPLVSLAGVLGLRDLEQRKVLRQPALALGLAALASYLGSLDALSELVLHPREYPYHVMGSRASIAAIEGMRAHLPPRSSVVAFRIGALGDVGDYVVVDLLGLADREIASIASETPGYHPQHTRMGEDVPRVRDYVHSLAPDGLLLLTYAEGDLDPSIELYGFTWRYADAYRIGIDQRWALYLRNDPERNEPELGDE